MTADTPIAKAALVSDDASTLAKRMMSRLARATDGLDSLPARKSVKVRPSDWLALERLIREGADALTIAQARIAALEEGLQPFAVRTPESVPDDTWTECKSYPVDEAAFRRPIPEGASNPCLILWMDGHPISDFRRAYSLLKDHSNG